MNVIFDLGGVVFKWKPDEIIRASFENEEDRVKVKTGIFGHSDWSELDRGTLSPEEAAARASARTGLPEQKILDMLDSVPEALIPIAESVALIEKVKHAGNRAYVLSNMHASALERIDSEYDFWKLFDGRIFSCSVKLIKPERAIYDHLLKTFNLEIFETVFIDDTDINLEAAEKMGIRTIRFTDAGSCENQLREMGCI